MIKYGTGRPSGSSTAVPPYPPERCALRLHGQCTPLALRGMPTKSSRPSRPRACMLSAASSTRTCAAAPSQQPTATHECCSLPCGPLNRRRPKPAPIRRRLRGAQVPCRGNCNTRTTLGQLGTRPTPGSSALRKCECHNFQRMDNTFTVRCPHEAPQITSQALHVATVRHKCGGYSGFALPQRIVCRVCPAQIECHKAGDKSPKQKKSARTPDTRC